MRIVLLLILLHTALAKRPCNRNTCLNGGTCTVNDENRRFQCDCPVGFSGLLCQESCSLRCVHGTCTKGSFGDEICRCEEGWLGSLCDVFAAQPLIDCTSDADCSPEERCVEKTDDVGNDVLGSFCEKNACNGNPCHNNATCTVHGDEYLCNCTSGFSGKQCEADINECELQVCLNGANCINLFGTFECRCAANFNGQYCEIAESRECATNVCQNDGTCTNVGNTVHCKCAPGFEGPLCEIEVIPECHCENPHHECSFLSKTKVCACPKGFKGETCTEHKVYPCELEPCLNGGHCVDHENGTYVCYCLPHWSGPSCGEPAECLVEGKRCDNGGKCIWALAMTRCECYGGFTGSHCQTKPVSTCSSMRCENGGTCVDDEHNEAKCLCSEGFSPPFCEDLSPCQPNPCHNGGTCQEADGHYFCHCPVAFNGLRCELEVTTSTTSTTTTTEATTTEDVPTNVPIHIVGNTSALTSFTCDDCVHASACMDSKSSSTCICEFGYLGEKCDQQHFECDATNCTEGEVCQLTTTAQEVLTHCACPVAHSGPACRQSNAVSFTSKSLFIHQSSNVRLGASSGSVAYDLKFAFRTTLPNAHLASSENILGEKILSVGLGDGKIYFNVSGVTFDELVPLKVNDGTWYQIRVIKTEKDLRALVKNKVGFVLYSADLPRQTVFDVFLTRLGKVSEENFFVGCIADASIDGIMIDFTDSTRSMHISQDCFRKEQCSVNTCQNGGACLDLWETSSCECKTPFLPPNCAFSLPQSTFGHGGKPSSVIISVDNEESHLLRNSLDLQFLMRSNKADSFIAYLGEKHNTEGTSSNYCILELKDGFLKARLRSGHKESVAQSKTYVSDNKEHLIHVFYDKMVLQVFVDGNLESSVSTRSRFVQDFYLEQIMLGSSNLSTTPTSFYKGWLQDIQINKKSLVIHPTSLTVDSFGTVYNSSNVLEGVVSDLVCTQQTCQHGTCKNTFNDYECVCEIGYTGRNCDNEDFCLQSRCSEDSHCRNTEKGHYCVSPITIANESIVRFDLDVLAPIRISNVDFALKTHSSQGHLMTLLLNNEKMIISVENRRLALLAETAFKLEPLISDGKWHQIRVSSNRIFIDNNPFNIPKKLFAVGNSKQATLVIGQQAPEALFACLDNVTIGDYPTLSFLNQSIDTDVDHWVLKTKTKTATTCVSSQQCGAFSNCLNGATCIDLWNKRKCSCAPGFSGEYCEENVNECRQSPCKHGRCVDGINKSSCICEPGFTGEQCEIPFDECEGRQCHNNGKCVQEGVRVVCQCDKNWMGSFCNVSISTDCSDTICRNGATCTQKVNSFECTCTEGFEGQLCEEKVSDECEEHHCSHGACVVGAKGPMCVCDEGYNGVHCEKFNNKCTDDTCGLNGHCESVWNSSLCKCEENWRGLFCEHAPDQCLKFPCLNDGVCEPTPLTGFRCRCPPFYLGDKCEVEGSCLKDPCIHGDCLQMNFEKHICNCFPGYEGPRCEKKIDYCVGNPCKNGASCQSMVTDFKCHCISGFSGKQCEKDIDECEYGYCSNGARCKDHINDYECICAGTGFRGKNCTEDINECEDAERCINGKCLNTNGGYKCTCTEGYIGSRCSMQDPCLPNFSNQTMHTCVHGQCVNPVVKLESGHEQSSYECVCNRGYTGLRCTTRVEEKKLFAMGYVLGPAIAVLSVLLIVGCLLFLFVMKGNNAMHGHYSPSSQENYGNRTQVNNMMKLPTQERLI